MKPVYYLIIILAVLFSGGCDSMRMSPAESLRQAAQIATDIADQVYVSGCEPGSETAALLKLSAEATQRYIGLARKIPANRFDVLKIARDQAYDPVTMADIAEGAETAIGIAEVAVTILGTGGLGLGLAKYLAVAKKAKKAVTELTGTKQGINKYMAQADPRSAAKLYDDIEGKIAKQTKPKPTTEI